MRKSLIGIASLLLTSCAISPLLPFPQNHPANAQAQEAAILPFQNILSSPDETTQKSFDLLSPRAPEASSPVVEKSHNMSEMPGMN